MTIERLVQEQGIDRAAILVTTDGVQNSAGEDAAGADTGTPGFSADAALNGGIVVAVALDDEAQAQAVRQAFAEFGGA